MLTALLLVMALSAAAGGLVWRATHPMQPAEQAALLVLPEPRAIPDFVLTDQDAGTFDLKRLKDRWSLLFFGFTHCPDICPGTLYDLQRLDETLAGEGLGGYQVVFVSVDPERDSPQRLKDYTAYFDPDFIAVTGGHVVLEPLTRDLGIAYRVEPHEPGDTAYQVDHSASVLLTDPQGRLHGVFPAPHDVDAMAAELRRLID